eukprot:scaffold1549_cov156-Amphora_coffeaeformis.AAC.6
MRLASTTTGMQHELPVCFFPLTVCFLIRHVLFFGLLAGTSSWVVQPFPPTSTQKRQARECRTLVWLSVSPNNDDIDKGILESIAENADLRRAVLDVPEEEELILDDVDSGEGILPIDVSEFVIETDSFLLKNGTATIPLADMHALSSNLSYFYLKNELGLSEEIMWKITYDAGAVLGMTADNIRHKVEVLRKLMDLTDEDLRTIIERQPSVLHLSADKNVSPTILNLLRSLDLSRDELKYLIVSFPGILTYSKTNLRAKIRFFKFILGLTTEQCRKAVLKEPTLFKTGVHSGLFPRTRFLLNDMQIPVEDLRQIVLRHPRILLYSLEKNLIPKLVFYCLMTIHLEPTQVAKLLRSYPDFIGYNLDRHILPITRYFLKDLDFSMPEFQKILLNYPRLMSNSLTKIKHVVGYLRFETDLSAAQVRRVLYQAPSLLGLNTDISVRNKVEYIRKTLELSDVDWKTLLVGIPNVLLLSVDRNLKPKMSYLLDAFDDDVDSLREAILRLPTLLGYSLEKRICPRMEAILEAGIDDPGSITVGIPMKEDRFEKWLQGRTNRQARQTSSPAEGSSLPSGKSTGSNPSEDFDASGRIIHWSRERRKKV